jgi:hypothetical protein
MPAEITCLRDYVHAAGLRDPPLCFYCGDRAVTLDHTRSRRGPKSRQKLHYQHSLKPACRRCSTRKGAQTRERFRARLEEIARVARDHGGAVVFHGEGARGRKLKRLCRILACMTLRRGELLVVAEGEPFTKPREPKKDKKKTDATPRWRGRFTFAGSRALRDISARSGYSFPVIERFILGERVHPLSAKAIGSALRALRLSVDALRGLRPTKSGRGG